VAEVPQRLPPAQPRPSRHIAVLQHRQVAQAQPLLALLALTHAQEGERLGLVQAPALATTLASLQASTRLHLGAWCGDTLVGALVLGPDDEADQQAVQTLVVHPDHQRQGHGQALLQAALQHSAGLVLAVVVGAANTAAVALYLRQGFAVYRQGWLTLETGDRVLMLKMRQQIPG